MDLTKTVRPATAVRPGDRVVVDLQTELAVSSSYVTADEVVITDAWDGAARGFWNAFDLQSVAPTQIPSGTAVTVDVQTAVGTWVTIRTEPAQAATWLLELDAATITAALPGGTSLRDATGVRFTLTRAVGFEENVTLTPYVVATARDTLRTGGALPTGDTQLTNVATAQGSGETDGGVPVDGDDDAGDEALVQPTPAGVGDVWVDKAWSAATVVAQSGQDRSTTLTWRSRAGVGTVAITDPTDPTTVSRTTFDAFDLRGIQAVARSSTPFTNGWYLRYDSVVDVQLYRPDGGGGFTWTSVTAPTGGWMSATGFVGYTLTTAQRADTRGVRLVLDENTAARTAARQVGTTFDPFAPAVGTGIVPASTDRSFTLNWRIREVRRSATAWVTGTATYNIATPGVVRNTVQIAGTPLAGGPAVTASDHADITITDVTPLVRHRQVGRADDPGLRAAARHGRHGELAHADLHRDRAQRLARPGVLRPRDRPRVLRLRRAGRRARSPTRPPTRSPARWTGWRPGTHASVFDHVDLTAVAVSASVPAEVDLAASVAWVLRYDGTDYTSERTTAAALADLTAAQLADVVGVSVTFQGTDPATTGGTIGRTNDLTLTLTTRVRSHVRSTGEAQTLLAGKSLELENHAYAQSYDPVLSPTVRAAATDDAAVTLTGGAIDVAASKSISPSTITEPRRTAAGDRHARRDAGDEHARARRGPAHRRRRELARVLGPVRPRRARRRHAARRRRPRPRGRASAPSASTVRPAWLLGTPATVAAVTLPATADLALVQGIRFTFLRADGGFYDAAIPAPGWSGRAAFTVRLRDSTRLDAEPIAIDASGASIDNTVVVQSDRLTGESSLQRSTSAIVTALRGHPSDCP